MAIKRVTINDSDELDILSLVTDIDICQVRCRLSWHFGSKVKIACPLRLQLKRKWEQYQADIEYKKFADKYPDDI